MNTNHEDTGVTVSLRKTGHVVHLDVSTIVGTSSLQLDDTKTVYTAMHEAKDDIAKLISDSIDKAMFWMTHDSDQVQVIEKDGLRIVTAGEASMVLDGKQVATTVAQPVLEMPDFGDLDALHAEALAEDALRTADDDGDEPPTKTETPAGKRPRKPKAA